MRSIWLASAAVIMTAGIAAAQTTSPAPTGAPNAPAESSNPAAAPGNMGSGRNSGGTHIGTSTGTFGTTGGSNTTAAVSPVAPTGAPKSPENSANPAMSPGNMAPGGSTASTSPAPASTTTAMAKPMHHGMGGMSVPENASADRYLHIAADAIKHHNNGVADDALSHAETRLLTRAVPASSGATTDDSPRVSAIENARKALSSGDYQTAADDTRQAMHGHMGGMGGMGMGHMDNGMSNGTGNAMPGTPLSTDSAAGSSAGNGK